MTQYFRNGDLVFLDEKEGLLSRAIADVTCRQFQVAGPNLSHLGILVQKQGEWMVLESRERVRKTPIQAFLQLAKPENPETKGWHWARLQPAHTSLIDPSLHWIEERIDTAYNHQYIPNEKSFYCAELIAESFRFANGGEPFFEYKPMYFGEPGDASFLIWEQHFQKMKKTIPIGKPGISPLGIYLCPSFQILR